MITIHIPTSTPDLPLLRTRFILIGLTHIFFTIAGSFCLKVFTKHRDVQHLINDSLPDGVKLQFEYDDVKTATIALFITTHLGTAFLSKILIFHLQEIYNFIPLVIARKLRIVDKKLASSTLGYQTIALAALIVLNSICMGFFTSITYRRSQSIVLLTADNIRLPESFAPQFLEHLGIALPYRESEYIRRTAILPWVAILWALPTAALTAVAWHRRRSFATAWPPSPEMSEVPSGLDEKKAQVEEITLENI